MLPVDVCPPPILFATVLPPEFVVIDDTCFKQSMFDKNVFMVVPLDD